MHLKLKLPGEIHSGVEIQELHGRRNQISQHHYYNHICSLSQRICKEEEEISLVVPDTNEKQEQIHIKHEKKKKKSY